MVGFDCDGAMLKSMMAAAATHTLEPLLLLPSPSPGLPLSLKNRNTISLLATLLTPAAYCR